MNYERELWKQPIHVGLFLNLFNFKNKKYCTYDWLYDISLYIQIVFHIPPLSSRFLFNLPLIMVQEIYWIELWKEDIILTVKNYTAFHFLTLNKFSIIIIAIPFHLFIHHCCFLRDQWRHCLLARRERNTANKRSTMPKDKSEIYV